MIFIVLSLMVTLVGCGGGGGQGNIVGTVPNVPIVPQIRAHAVGPIFATRQSRIEYSWPRSESISGEVDVLLNATISVKTDLGDDVLPPQVSVRPVGGGVGIDLIPIAVDGTVWAHYRFLRNVAMNPSTIYEVLVDGVSKGQFTTGTRTGDPVEDFTLIYDNVGMSRCLPLLGSREFPVESSTFFAPQFVVDEGGPYQGADRIEISGPTQPTAVVQPDAFLGLPSLALIMDPLADGALYEIKLFRGQQVLADGWVRTNSRLSRKLNQRTAQH